MKTLSNLLPSTENAFTGFFVFLISCFALHYSLSDMGVFNISEPVQEQTATNRSVENDHGPGKQIKQADYQEDAAKEKTENYKRSVRFIECKDCLPDGKVIVRFIRNSRILDVGSF